MKTAYCRTCIEALESRVAPAFAATFNVAGLAGFNGFQLTGISTGDGAGISISSVGDINGDGFDDIVIGASFVDGQAQNDVGEAYVVFGKASGQPLAIDLSSLDGSDGFRIIGVQIANAQGGNSVSGAGDVNGDGFDDVIIGSPGSNSANVIFGKATFGATVSLGALLPTDGITILGEAGGDRFGTSVSAAGDVNGDGFADVIIGAPNATANGTFSGASYVVFGKSSFTGFIAAAALSGTDGFQISGEVQNGFAGQSVARAGDVNGDGFSDVIVGANGVNNSAGAAYVVYGKASGFVADLNLASLNGSNGFQISGENAADVAGYSVAGAGDFNGDGFSDVIIGAFGAATSKGAAYVVFGKGTSFGPNLNLSSLTSATGFKLVGEATADQAGLSVASAGDINGDGFSDIIIGAPGANGSGNHLGAAYVIFGDATRFTSLGQLSQLDGVSGFRIDGESTNGLLGRSVGGGGDLNGDGFADLLAGAPASGGTGTAYAIYGTPSGTKITPTLAGKTATFTDIDGDIVTVKVSKGTLVAANFDLLQPHTEAGAELLELKFGSAFAGANVTVTVKRSATGDGLVHLGFLNATGTDLGVVKIKGDLERIVAGDDDDLTPAVKSLTAHTLGRAGLPLQELGGTLASGFTGPLGALTLSGDFAIGTIIVSGKNLSSQGVIGKIKIAGSVIGGEHSTSGAILATGNIGPVTIGRDLLAGDGTSSGLILSFNRLGAVKVGGDVHGGLSGSSGAIVASNNVASVDIGGSLIAGESTNSGLISAGGFLPRVAIRGDIVGGRIFSGASLGSVSIKGDVVGTADAPATIAATGPLTGTSSVAIGSFKVGGRVEHAEVLAGVNSLLNTVNGHTQIGKVLVGGDWIASDLVAGASAGGAGFGNGDDALNANGPSGVVARIASIVIKGGVRGTVEGGDSYAFEAAQIGSLKIGPVKYTLTAGPGNDQFVIGNTADVKVRELS